MNQLPATKKLWNLTQEAFDKLLEQLDSDRNRAGDKYEKIRQKLMKFFKWRGCALPEQYTDETIDRVARRILEGAQMRVSDPYLYFHGVALNVLREHWREPERGLEAIDDLPPGLSPADDPIEINERLAERLDLEQRLECLGSCMARLPADELKLITDYHQGEKGEKIEGRKNLAKRLKIPLNALRIRAYRIRAELEGCIESCVKEHAR